MIYECEVLCFSGLLWKVMRKSPLKWRISITLPRRRSLGVRQTITLQSRSKSRFEEISNFWPKSWGKCTFLTIWKAKKHAFYLQHHKNTCQGIFLKEKQTETKFQIFDQNHGKPLEKWRIAKIANFSTIWEWHFYS